MWSIDIINKATMKRIISTLIAFDGANFILWREEHILLVAMFFILSIVQTIPHGSLKQNICRFEVVSNLVYVVQFVLLYGPSAGSLIWREMPAGPKEPRQQFPAGWFI